MCMPGGGASSGGGASGPNYTNYDRLKGAGPDGSGGTGWQFVGAPVKQADGTYKQLVRQPASNAAASRGTGSQSERWILARPPTVAAKPAVKAAVKAPVKIKVDPATRVTNNPNTTYTGPNKLRTGPGGGAYDNVFAKWGETYFNNNKAQAEDAATRLGRGRYAGAPRTVATLGGTT